MPPPDDGLNREQSLTDDELFANFAYRKTALPLHQASAVILKLKKEIPDHCYTRFCGGITYFKILELLSNGFRENIYVFGGAVRDFIKTGDTATMNDIDINYTASKDVIRSRLERIPHLRFTVEEDKDYILVGNKAQHEYLEGFRIQQFSYRKSSLETPCNSLFLEIKEDSVYLIDLFDGQSVADAINMVYRSPATPGTPDFVEWCVSQPKLLWRSIKFRLRGYTVPDEVAVALYKTWYSPDHRATRRWDKAWSIIPETKKGEALHMMEHDVTRFNAAGLLDFTFQDILNLFREKGVL
jgi:hypothetical protein